MTFEVVFTREADADLEAITDTRTRAAIIRKASELETEPMAKGKPLSGSLKDYRSLRAAGQRYRTIYQVGVLEGRVTVVVIGIRQEDDKRDVYGVAGKR
ncbi:type II toxin-antitoxin system RelE family toxin [Truepera radiovictrix]|uniref:Plasmid stabilization system n=1 Tax=Truepera radiovictrix (strain DSM 17093 / CIP 108686 / LMG 22925 / RQ-24) TaxID=649638 RepID=D7CRD5_TRURR|nr:type II toxin-antitoxin system RelE/ParE family toxin [Truepera radiovictrix]ADI15223.1 plasmid stabilization system [Truepera radiovictrix DSM 17093]WMT56224.1 type II toxin-antitoxin system RelE/ParE family toxin [Truepera radiovictrix]